VERQLDVQQGEWLRGSCGAIFGCIAKRVALKELLIGSCIYNSATG